MSHSRKRVVRLSENRAAAADLLRAVYETFTEGFTSPDLQDARAVLSGVDAPVV